MQGGACQASPRARLSGDLLIKCTRVATSMRHRSGETHHIRIGFFGNAVQRVRYSNCRMSAATQSRLAIIDRLLLYLKQLSQAKNSDNTKYKYIYVVPGGQDGLTKKKTLTVSAPTQPQHHNKLNIEQTFVFNEWIYRGPFNTTFY